VSTIVVALDRTVSPKVVDYVRGLAAVGKPVCIVLVDEATADRFRSTDGFEPGPLLEVRALLAAEPFAGLGPGLGRLYGALARPWLLGRHWRALTTAAASAERIVAADLAATTLVWRLCRRHPHVVATTALDPPVAV
jgi:hypothetical protein